MNVVICIDCRFTRLKIGCGNLKKFILFILEVTNFRYYILLTIIPAKIKEPFKS